MKELHRYLWKEGVYINLASSLEFKLRVRTLPHTVLFSFPLQLQASVGHIDLNKPLSLEGFTDLKTPGKNYAALSQKEISMRDSKLVPTDRVQGHILIANVL